MPLPGQRLSTLSFGVRLTGPRWGAWKASDSSSARAGGQRPILEPAGNWYEIGTKPTQAHNDEGRPDGRPSRSRSAGLQGSCKSYALVGRDSGGGFRTRDLRVTTENAHLGSRLGAS